MLRYEATLKELRALSNFVYEYKLYFHEYSNESEFIEEGKQPVGDLEKYKKDLLEEYQLKFTQIKFKDNCDFHLKKAIELSEEDNLEKIYIDLLRQHEALLSNYIQRLIVLIENCIQIKLEDDHTAYLNYIRLLNYNQKFNDFAINRTKDIIQKINDLNSNSSLLSTDSKDIELKSFRDGDLDQMEKGRTSDTELEPFIDKKNKDREKPSPFKQLSTAKKKLEKKALLKKLKKGGAITATSVGFATSTVGIIAFFKVRSDNATWIQNQIQEHTNLAHQYLKEFEMPKCRFDSIFNNACRWLDQFANQECKEIYASICKENNIIKDLNHSNPTTHPQSPLIPIILIAGGLIIFSLSLCYLFWLLKTCYAGPVTPPVPAIAAAPPIAPVPPVKWSKTSLVNILSTKDKNELKAACKKLKIPFDEHEDTNAAIKRLHKEQLRRQVNFAFFSASYQKNIDDNPIHSFFERDRNYDNTEKILRFTAE